MCVEGTLLFMTANNPEKMDYAMIQIEYVGLISR